MGNYEKRLEAARRQVADQELLIAAFKRATADLQQTKADAELDEKMLKSMEQSLAAFQADLARLSN